jgi:hypothetical protein
MDAVYLEEKTKQNKVNPGSTEESPATPERASIDQGNPATPPVAQTQETVVSEAPFPEQEKPDVQPEVQQNA